LFEETSFRALLGQRQGFCVGGARLFDAPQLPAEFPPRRMHPVVIQQLAACQNALHLLQPRQRPIAHGQGYGAVQFDHR